MTRLKLVPSSVRERTFVEVHREPLQKPNGDVTVSEAQALADEAADVVDADLVGSLVRDRRSVLAMTVA
jgi:hypothetical protein